MEKIMAKERKGEKMSKKVSVFNPFAGAYCELDIELAKKFVASAEEVRKQIKKIEKEEAKSG
jgi:hypothetical protein